jgi:hypothetical protein
MEAFLPPGTLTGAAHNALLQLSVAPGSIIVWHDYGRFGINGVSRWLHEFAAQGRELYRVPGGSLAYMRV